MVNKRLFLTTNLAVILTFTQVKATEGMWVPGMIQQLVSDNMESMGMKISLSDLYAINQSSIKDAVVHFNGGCTSVLVSDQALLLTNHHCGYSSIQSHSSLENNYLKDGFWAKSLGEELANPNMNATIIKEIRDVTNELIGDLSVDATENDRAKHIKEKSQIIIDEMKSSTGFDAYIKPFYLGNQYLLFVVEVFEDVRLVGAPPSSIGKFGFDTDNWVWPRHTGDFSVFRIYASVKNEPAPYNIDNVPYRPKHFLPINLGGVVENDFTLVYGFPGVTENYISRSETENVLEVINPLRLKMRAASLQVIDAAMRQDELTHIQYAAKQSRISNAYKKWIGQSKGLLRHKALDKKDSLESLFSQRVAANPQWRDRYSTLLGEIQALEAAELPLMVSRNYLIEFMYMGPEILRFAERYRELETMSEDPLVSDEAISAWIDEQRTKMGYFKNYNPHIDQDIMLAQIQYFIEDQPDADFLSGIKKEGETLETFVERLYKESFLVSEEATLQLLDKYKRNRVKKLDKDPAYAFSKRIMEHYTNETKPDLAAFVSTGDSLMRVWMQAQLEVLPERTYSPDANGTLRITFGKVEGYTPFDGAEYTYFTTLEGVMEKEDETSEEFEVPAKLKELYKNKDFGPYADAEGRMRVCFIASNHTSGGNSGSPVIDANGRLIGLNFDRTWESTMSDIMFNPTICRNITVDIRYVLFIIDKYAGAEHLVNEMQLVN